MHPWQCFIVHLRSELILIGWEFMHELNISPLLSLTSVFLTKQLIYNSKIEKHNFILDIFVPDTKPEAFIYLEKEHFSYIRTRTPLFGSDFGIRVAQKQRKFEDHDFIII